MPQRITVPMTDVQRVTVPMSEIRRSSGAPKPPPATGFGGTGTYTHAMSPQDLAGELNLQMYERLGLDPSSPVVGTVKNWISGMGNLVKAGVSMMRPTTEVASDPEGFRRDISPITSIPGQVIGNVPEFMGGMSRGLSGDEEGWQQAARGAIGIGTETLPTAVGVASGFRGAARSAAQSRNVRLGRVTPDAAPIPFSQPVEVQVGGAIPNTSTQQLKFHPAVEMLASSVSGKSKLRTHMQFQEAFNEALPDLKQAQLDRRLGAMNTLQKHRIAASTARNKLWNESIAPSIQGKVSLEPVADHMRSIIADELKTATIPEEVRFLKRMSSLLLDDKGMPRIVDAKYLHGMTKEARAAIRAALQKNNFDQAAAFETPRGKVAHAFNESLRDTLYEHVQRTTGTDIRPSMRRYGALSEIEEALLESAMPKTVWERIGESRYYPTKRAIAATTAQIAAETIAADITKMRKAFDLYKHDPSLVSKPFTPVPPPVYTSSIGGQTNLPPRPPSFIAAEEGLVAGAEGYKTPIHKGLGVYEFSPGPQRTMTGQQPPLPERPFYPGKSGTVRELTPEGTPVIRDYTDQGQLFSLYQTPPPRWQPRMRDTFMLSDLKSMRDEIMLYIRKANPTGRNLNDYMADLKAVNDEIYRREQAMRTPSSAPKPPSP